MQVKIKKLNKTAVLPKYGKPGDAGMDLVAVSKSTDENGNIVYGTGLAFEIPEGYVGLIFPRSSNAKYDLMLTNHVGVVDSGYRGEVMFKFRNTPVFRTLTQAPFYRDYEIGDRIGQIIIMPYPAIEFIESDELSDSERGQEGFGSTGK